MMVDADMRNESVEFTLLIHTSTMWLLVVHREQSHVGIDPSVLALFFPFSSWTA
jgi:hypothetical protein